MQPIFQWVDTSPHTPPTPQRKKKQLGQDFCSLNSKPWTEGTTLNHNFGTDKTFPFLICHPLFRKSYIELFV